MNGLLSRTRPCQRNDLHGRSGSEHCRPQLAGTLQPAWPCGFPVCREPTRLPSRRMIDCSLIDEGSSGERESQSLFSPGMRGMCLWEKRGLMKRFDLCYSEGEAHVANEEVRSGVLNADGLLPPGIHDMTLDEVKALFGRFQQTDRRPTLFAKLQALVADLQALNFVPHLIVDGSFVTSAPLPGDIDLLLAIDPKILEKPEWAPVEYNVLSSSRLRRRYGVDVLVAPIGGKAYAQYVALFSRVKGSPGKQKGLVRILL